MLEIDLDVYNHSKYRRRFFENRTITVFGGTGTIGSLIVEYLQTQKPYAIRVFSNDENSMWEAQQKWIARDEMRYLIGDIRNYERVKDAIHGVDYVFNCAAIKHVPFAEYNPLEAVDVNIHGLHNIVRACVHHKVKKILHISTDKAVEPSCVMGNTKAISEKVLQTVWSQNPTIGMVCVRLGNVWDSRGSIIPLVKECQRLQKPVPITSPSMTRFFMKPHEVVEFIMKAFMEGGDGEIYIPKLNAVSIMDVIRGEIGEFTYEEIGLRKGEKLTEKLITTEELSYCIEKEKYWIIPNKLQKV